MFYILELIMKIVHNYPTGSAPNEDRRRGNEGDFLLRNDSAAAEAFR
jgi:hypothetical protein